MQRWLERGDEPTEFERTRALRYPLHEAVRVLTVEHRLYPLALALVAAGRVRLVEGRCRIERPRPVDAMLLVPDV